MIQITDIAKQRITEFMHTENRPGLALRFGILGRGPGGFQYRLAFVDASDRAPSDTVFEAGPFDVLIDSESAPYLEGVTIDFMDGPRESGFKIDNPNPLWSEPLARAVQKVLEPTYFVSIPLAAMIAACEGAGYVVGDDASGILCGADGRETAAAINPEFNRVYTSTHFASGARSTASRARRPDSSASSQ